MRYGKVVVSAKVSCEAAGQKSHEKSCDMGRLLFPRRSAAKQQDKKVTKSHAIWEGCCFREGQLPSSWTKKSRM